MSDAKLTSEEMAEIEGRSILAIGSDALTMQRYGEIAANSDVPRLLRHIGAKGYSAKDLGTVVLELVATQLEKALGQAGFPDATRKQVELVKVMSCTVHVTDAVKGSLVMDCRLELKK